MTDMQTPQDLADRLWNLDVSLWSNDRSVQRSIEDRLGWLNVAVAMRERLTELQSFATEVKDAGFRNVVLLGMGGSSLAPEVIGGVFGSAPEYPRLSVLDTTDPDAILATERAIDLRHTLFIVATKSGTTTETRSLYRHFWEQLAKQGATPGPHFIAITDPGTVLESQAAEQDFRRTFINPPDIGGRYSALSYFGLVPAALIGAPADSLLESAEEQSQQWRSGAPGASNPIAFGVWMATNAKEGRDKLTVVTSPGLANFGDWVEQLIAESTGKQGVGIVPIVDEAVGPPSVYGDDRVFVSVSLLDEQSSAASDLEALSAAGHPVISWSIPDKSALGAEFLRWEIATAIAGAVLGINPFDEPNVQESKDNTSRVLAEFASKGELPEPNPSLTESGIAVYASGSPASLEAAIAELLGRINAGCYVATMAYCERTPAIIAALQSIRLAIRDQYKAATTLGFGPRFLHSTGQLHKGGPSTGVFLQITADDAEDAPVPGEPYSFATLKRAQAIGDLQALQSRNLPALRLHLPSDAVTALERIHLVFSEALTAKPRK